MLVYVINQHGKPLMPCSARKARVLLKEGKAIVIRREPFTIQLKFGSSGYKQPITLGVDAGAKHIGLSSSTVKHELYSSEVELRTDITDLLSTRRELRRARRNRKTRYRQPRFLNRVKAKKKGWLAPSILNRINAHLKVVDNVCKIFPVTKIIVETASFDIQKLKNPKINGIEYQQGEQLNFWNVREYVLFRDNYECQHCHGKSKDNILNVHHLESRKTGGDAPNNLITLCETCHKEYHESKIKLKQTRGQSFKTEAFMNSMRWAFFNKLKEIYPSLEIKNTYGYLTKNARINAELPKEHYIDAYCIAGNLQAKRLNYYYYQKQVRKHNRQIHKFTINKGGTRKRNQSPFELFNYRLFDKVKCKGEVGFIFGRRASGSFDIRKLDGTKISAGISYKKLGLITKRKTYLTERRNRAYLMSRLKKKIENGLLSAINWSKLMVLRSSSRLLRKKVIASWQPIPVKGPKMLKALTDAMTYNANIRINYRNSGWRTILPYGWNTSREGNILVMCYKDTGEIRSYRLDRIYDLLIEDNLSDHHDDMLTWEDFQMPTLPNIDEIIEETEAEIDNEPLPYDAGLKALTTNRVDDNIVNKEEQYKDGEDLSDIDLSINEEPSDNNDTEKDSSTNALDESNDNAEENVEIDSDESADKSTSSDNEPEQPIENNSNEEANINFDDVISSLEEESNNEEK